MRYSSVETFFFEIPDGPVAITLMILQIPEGEPSPSLVVCLCVHAGSPSDLLLPGVLGSGSDRDLQGVVDKGRKNHSLNWSWRQENRKVKTFHA